VPRTLVGVKLTPTELTLLDRLVSARGYLSRGEALRDALRWQWDGQALPGELRERLRLERIASPPRCRPGSD